MFNNMKSMLKVASLFKDETDKKTIKQTSRISNSNSYQDTNKNGYSNLNTSNNTYRNSNDIYNTYRDFSNIKDDSYDVSPTFFIES